MKNKTDCVELFVRKQIFEFVAFCKEKKIKNPSISIVLKIPPGDEHGSASEYRLLFERTDLDVKSNYKNYKPAKIKKWTY